MGELVVTIPASEITEGDEILVPLTIPPTRVKVWKVEDNIMSGVILLHLMEGERSWSRTLKNTYLVQIVI